MFNPFSFYKIDYFPPMAMSSCFHKYSLFPFQFVFVFCCTFPMICFAILEVGVSVGGWVDEYSELEQCRSLMFPTTPQALCLDFQIEFVFDLESVFLLT